MPSGDLVGEQPRAEGNEPAHEDRAEHPIEEQLPGVVERVLHGEPHPAPRSKPVGRLDLAEGRHEEHRCRRKAGRDDRPQSIEPQQCGQAEGQP
jgi:hypothetical protein